MALEHIDTSPGVGDFALLSEHQERTPGTFFGGKPVLHLHSPNASVKVSREDLASQPAIASLLGPERSTSEEEQVLIEDIDVWVSSGHFSLFSTARGVGVQLPYPTITVHAQEGSAVLLGLNLSDVDTADEDLVFIQLRITPTTIEHHEPSTADNQQPQQQNGNTVSPVVALFKAISECQELNPDPQEDDDERGFDETAPGATGWITSENMQDFIDENGEFRMPEGATVIGEEDDVVESGHQDSLGEGAGRTRTAAEVEAVDGAAEDETKWQRTD